MVMVQVRFVVMGNIMMSDVVIHKLFDLKGSTAGRFTDGPVKPTTVFKDLDLDCTFKLEEGWWAPPSPLTLAAPMDTGNALSVMFPKGALPACIRPPHSAPTCGHPTGASGLCGK